MIPADWSQERIDAYLAGIFDGEGCISAGFNPRNTIWLTLTVSMTTPQPVMMFHERFGGRYSAIKVKLGCKPAVSWVMSNGQAYDAITMLSQNCLVKASALSDAARLSKMMLNNPSGLFTAPSERIERAKLVLSIREKVGSRVPVNMDRLNNYVSYTPLRKPVVNSSGQTFPSIREASRQCGVDKANIVSSIKNGWKCGGVNWSFVA